MKSISGLLSCSHAGLSTIPGFASFLICILLNVHPFGIYAMIAVGTAIVPCASAEEAIASATQQMPQETPAEAADRMTHRFTAAPERLSVRAPEGDVPLGSPININVVFAPGKVAQLDVLQSGPHGAVSHSHGTYKIISEDEQTKTLEIVPMQLGSVDLFIGAVYSDNAIAEKTIHLNVVPSAKGLKKFSLAGGSNVAPLVLEDEEKDRQLWLQPVLTYEQVKFPIQLDDSTQIKLTVEQNESDPVIRVDPNGMVHALREGAAVIVGDFDGAIDRLKITVYSKEDAPVEYRRVTQ